MEFLKDLIGYIVQRKKYWLAPLILALLFLGGLVLMIETAPVLPVIYPVF